MEFDFAGKKTERELSLSLWRKRWQIADFDGRKTLGDSQLLYEQLGETERFSLSNRARKEETRSRRSDLQDAAMNGLHYITRWEEYLAEWVS